MADALLTGIYTLTPTHCGTGQSSGAVDLPIARESTTRLPILPATSLKGVARDALGKRDSDEDLLDWLFGPKISGGGKGEDKEAEDKDRPRGAGTLVFGEGFLLAFPLRSLNRPLLYGTSLLLIERWTRICKAHRLSTPVSWDDKIWTKMDRSGASVADAALAGSPLVVEDTVLDRDQVGHEPALGVLGDAFSALLPLGETRTRARLKRDLVLLPDRLLLDLLEHAPPVTARTQLTSAKTTSRVEIEGGGSEAGNLWYEETLPPDCLFGCVIAPRVDSKSHPKHGQPITRFQEWAKDRLLHVQIGGNETVGQGRCWWTVGGAP